MQDGAVAGGVGLVGVSLLLLSTPPPLPRVPPPPQITLLAGGDVMLGRGVDRRMAETGDFALPLRQLGPLLRAADLAFVNLESPLCPQGPYGEPGTMVLRARPEAVRTLAEAGVDVVSLANNHALDCGARGLLLTRERLAEAGIAAVGAGESFEAAHGGAVLERGGLRVGFLAYTYAARNDWPGARGAVVAGLDPSQLEADIRALRARSDVVVVSLHAGTEYSPRPHPEQQRFARRAVGAGAHLILGHHPHVRQPSEPHGSARIFYSLGNLVFDQPWPETRRGGLVRARVVGRKLVEAELLTVEIENLCCPRLVEPTENPPEAN